jgi:hypothetical protein
MINECRAVGGMRSNKGNSHTLRKLDQTPEVGSNTGRRAEKLAANRLSYATAWIVLTMK